MQDEIRQFSTGPLQTNTYAYISNGSCVVVDPAGEGAQLAAALADVKVELIACTHGHNDHVGGVAALKAATGARYLIHEADDEMARHAGYMDEFFMSFDDDAPAPDGYLAEGDVLEVGSARFTVIETPGHTPGSICLVGSGSAEDVVFSGDTLFAGSRGRTDLEGGDEAAIMASLERLKREIAPTATVLSGHGPATTMEREVRCNPFLR